MSPLAKSYHPDTGFDTFGYNSMSLDILTKQNLEVILALNFGYSAMSPYRSRLSRLSSPRLPSLPLLGKLVNDNGDGKKEEKDKDKDKDKDKVPVELI